VIDVGGGDSRLVDYLVARGLRCISVLDISGAALARAKARLAAAASHVDWIEVDVTTLWSARTVDVWHDRAAFHFLTDADDRRRYTERARRHVRAGGHLVLATFAPDGPTQCSGLPVVRYSPESLAAEMGSGFALVDAASEPHTTPSGGVQRFQYAVFRHVIG
jgi:SAM-dependent methyltransferase